MDRLAAEIRMACRDRPYFEDLVITKINSGVDDHDGKPVKHLRIYSTKDSFDRGEVSDIIERLKPLKMDIEVAAPLLKFVPAKT